MTLYNPASVSIQFGDLVVAEMRERPGAGTMTSPTLANDDNVATIAWTATIGQYTEIRLPYPSRVNEWRYYGEATSNADGTWKLEYQDTDGIWHDWVLAIPTRVASWSAFAGATLITAIAIRITAVTIDTVGTNYCGELEVRYN